MNKHGMSMVYAFQLAVIFIGFMIFVYTLDWRGIFSGSSALCTFAAIAGGEALAFLFAASGIGIAMIYPTVMAFIAKRYPKGSDTAITFTVTLMGLGSVIGNYAIGGVIELVKRSFGADSAIGLLRGLQAGYGVIGLCAAFSAISGIILFVYLKRRQQLI